eukprot:CAMPEP_0194320878 /NCGR_PEP_ID=MMETSP0171-20130528/17146_1 /TAXON_ID=218684 /ORGANISM="Corethron pennatum, Strain L29A3" /LENGTH=460 /DNA_ID=CAMNT_0039078573 /DNA_START=144 /DNA_END=1526 /DNA_ORIENTATION=+
MSDQQSLIPRHQGWPLINIREPHNNDVLCGRGGGAQNHAGNYKYRHLVNNNKIRYLTGSKKIKPIVARELVETIYRMDPPGRFLELCTTTGTYFDIGEAKAAQKVSQALREGAPEIRKHLEKLRAPSPTLTSMSSPAPQNTADRTSPQGMTLAHSINMTNCDQSSRAADTPTLKAEEPGSSNFNPHNPDISASAVQNKYFNSANERRPATTPTVSKQADEIRKQIEKIAASTRPPVDPPRPSKNSNWRLPYDGLDENTEKALIESDGMSRLSTTSICPEGMFESLRSLKMEDEEELSVTYERGNRQKMHSLEMMDLGDEKCDYVPPAPLEAPARNHFNPNFDLFDTEDEELLKKFRNGSFNESGSIWSSEASKMTCKSIETFPMDCHSHSGRTRFSFGTTETSKLSFKSTDTFPMDCHSHSGRKRFSIDSSKLSLSSKMSFTSLALQAEMSRDQIKEGPD